MPAFSVQLREAYFKAVSVGGSRGQKAEINVTPMIDVLLILAIIFMAITPITPRGLDTLVPQPSAAEPGVAAPSHAIVITVGSDRTVRLNGEPMDMENLRGTVRSRRGSGPR